MPKYTLLILVAGRRIELTLDEATYKALLATPRDDSFQIKVEASEHGELRASRSLI